MRHIGWTRAAVGLGVVIPRLWRFVEWWLLVRLGFLLLVVLVVLVVVAVVVAVAVAVAVAAVWARAAPTNCSS